MPSDTEPAESATSKPAMDPAALYESLMATSILSGGRFATADIVHCSWTYKHRASNSSISISTQHRISCNNVDDNIDTPILTESLLLSVHCLRKCCNAFIRKPTSKNDPLHIEIVRKNQPALSTCLKSVCQSIPKASIFSGAEFSPNCSAVAFVADRFEKVPKSFWPASDATSAPDENLGTEYDYYPNWGEGIAQLHPVIVVAEISGNTLKVRRVENFGDDCCWGQVSWHPKIDNTLIAVGFPDDPRRLGLLHYQTRPCALYKVDTTKDEKAKILTKDDHSASFGRFSPNGRYLAYFSTDDVQWHGSGSRCRVYNWETKQSRTIVEIVRKSEDFPGLYLRGVPNRVWLSNSQTIIVNTQWRCQMALIAINVESGVVTRISLPAQYHSGNAEVLDILGNTALVRVDDIDLVPVPMLCILNVKASGEITFQWKLVSNVPCPPPELSSVKYEIIKTPITESSDHMESILVYPQQEPEKSRLVLFPHGGPHSGFCTNYSINIMYMLSMGFSLLLVNYRGSTGFGQDALESLPGKCGKQDVEDCMSVLESVLKKRDFRDVAVTGGSHGGFLTLWLIGLYPKTFKAAAARNPVANIAHMISTSDIPDWCVVECGINWNPKVPLTGEEYKKMYEASPISVIQNVQTPLLLMLGEVDKRCPASQSIDYYKQLRALGSPCRCIIYPENAHALTDRVDTEADHWVNIVKWLQQ